MIMLECDYRYIMEKTDDMLAGFQYGRTLEEISNRFKKSGVKAKVDGKYYCISKNAALLFNEYKDSITSVAVRVAHVSDVPFSEVKNFLLKKRTSQIGDICFESFFNCALSKCMGYAAMCVPDIFESMRFYANERQIMPGEMLCTPGDEVYGTHGTKYVLHNNGIIQVRKIRKEQNEIKITNIYQGSMKEKAYVLIINDMTSGIDKKILNKARRTAICTLVPQGKINAESAVFKTNERRTCTWKQQGR